jgi:hypothetical protein
MSTLDEITKEKQRIGEALARVDAQREKLTGQLSELEAAERVLARYSKGLRGLHPPSPDRDPAAVPFHTAQQEQPSAPQKDS